jgi:hypothetical protein
MAATEAPSTPPVEEILVRERRDRPRAGFAALAAAVLAVLAGVLPQAIYADFPRVYLLDALRDGAGERAGQPGLRTAQVLFIHDKALPLLAATLVQAAMVLLVGFILVFLLRAAADRGATAPRMARTLAIVGAGASALGAVVLQIGVMTDASRFAGSSDHSTAAAHDALRGAAVVAGSAVGFFGGLALAAAFVMISIGAMRIGLLTRFVGVLGAICGVLLVLGPATGSSTFIVQTFWLLMVALLLLGRWPAGTPPAWQSGEGMPWPSQQEIREARQRGRGAAPASGRGSRAERDEPGVPGEPGAPQGDAPSPATSARKKRKRRG